MADPGDRLRCALTDEQHERIFQQEVLPSELPASTCVANPTAVVLGGQPGAGKTALLTAADLELQAKGSAVTINGKLLRPFHPKYRALQKAVPLDAPACCERWLRLFLTIRISCGPRLRGPRTLRRARPAPPASCQSHRDAQSGRRV